MTESLRIPQWLLVFDIDGTQVTAEIGEYKNKLTAQGYSEDDIEKLIIEAKVDAMALKILAEEAQKTGELVFAHCSGRVKGLVLEAIAKPYDGIQLTEAKAVSGGVGTQILMRDDQGEYDDLQSWHDRMEADFDQTIRDAVEDVRSEFDTIEYQPKKKLGPHKISFNVGEGKTADEQRDICDAFVANLKDKLGEDAMDKLMLTVSHFGGDEGAYVDITPASSGKGNTALALAEHFDVPHSNIIVAGDTGNDQTMFDTVIAAGGHGIIPANGQEIADLLDEDTLSHCFRSKTGMAATGVLEGLEKIGVFSKQQIEQARNQVKLGL